MFPFCILTTSLCFQLIITPKIEAPAKDVLEQRIMTEILPALARCESGRDGMKAFNKDDGKIGQHSWGKYQWQVESWNWATNYFGLKDYDIMNEQHQDDLTMRIIADGRGHKLWKNCWRKMKLFEI